MDEYSGTLEVQYPISTDLTDYFLVCGEEIFCPQVPVQLSRLAMKSGLGAITTVRSREREF